MGSEAPAPSARIAARYTVLDRLGEGGMGTVFRVRDEAGGGRLLALKKLHDPRLTAEFRRTFSALAGLHHPALPAMHDLGQDPADALPFCTMELRRGVDLTRYAETATPAQLGAALAELAATLAYLHAHGLIHADLSPSNVLVEPDGTLSLLDPGGAAGTPGVSGTLPYLAPERLAGDAAAPAGDLFSLGALGLEALTGSHPFPDYPRRPIRPGDEPQPARGLDAAGLELFAALASLVAPSPADRPASAEVVARALRPAEPVFGPRVLAALWRTPPFVDSRGQLERALGWLGAARAATGGALAYVHGAPGAGKTRLLREICLRAQLGGRRVAHAAALPGDAPGALAARLLLALGVATDLLGEPVADPDEPGLGAEDRAQAARGQLLGVLRTAADGAPTLLVVDDIGEADTLSREVLLEWGRGAVGGAAGTRTELLFADRRRPDELAGLLPPGVPTEPGAHFLPLGLGPWDAEAVGQLGAAVLPGRTLSEALQNESLVASGGLPWLLTAQLSALAEAGGLRVDADSWHLAPGAALRVETAQTAWWAEGLRRLPDAARAVLQALAVLGRPVSFETLAQVVPAAPAVVEPALSQLAREGFAVRSVAGGVAAYALASAALRAWLDERLEPAARRQLHARAAAVLAAEPGPDSPVRAAALATHLLASASPPAADYEAGARAAVRAVAGLISRGAAERAWSLVAQLQPAALPGALRRDAYRAQARVCAATGRFADGLAAIEAAANPAGTAAEAAERLLLRGDLLRRAGRTADAAAALGEAAETALGAGDPRLAARAQLLTASLTLHQGDYDATLAAVAAAEAALADLPGDSELRAEAAYHRGLVLAYRAAPSAALAELDTARATFAERADAAGLARTLNAVALVHFRAGDLAAAAAAYREAADTAAQSGDRKRVWLSHMNLGATLQAQGDLAGALAAYRECLTLAQVLDDAEGVARVANNLGNALGQVGQLAEAEAAVSLSLGLAERHALRLLVAHNRALLGELAGLTGRFEAAETAFATARAGFEALGARREVCEVLCHRAWLALDRGQPAAALEAADEALTLAQTLASAPLEVQALTVRAEVERMRPGGAFERAAAWLAQAGQHALQVGRPALLWRLALVRFRLHRDTGAAAAALQAAREAVRALHDLEYALPSDLRESFRALRPHAAVLRELQWLGALSPAGDDPGAGRSFVRILEINKRLLAEHDPQRLLEFILDSAIVLSGAERGFLLLAPDPGQDEARVVVARNFDRENIRRRQDRLSTSVVQQVLRSGEGLLAVDAMEEPRFQQTRSVHNLRLRSLLCVPLRQGSAIGGVLYVDNRFQKGAFCEADLASLEAFADQAAIGLANARLVDALKRSEEALLSSRREVESLNERLRQALQETSAELAATSEMVRQQRRQLQVRSDYSQIVGTSDALQQVFHVIDRVRDNTVPVLIQGESGTGKELVARAIHFNGVRRDGPFVTINCASIPSTLMESELFGHARGAFTGATSDKKGLFEVAHGGTLLLDEVGEMPPEMQVKLLRAIQSGELQRIGDTRRVQVDVRIIGATNRDLRERVAQGAFREDLYYRLNVVTVRLPPLRARPADIPLLVDYFCEQNRADGISPVRGIRKDALRLLMRYAWPGNVRELAAVIKNASIFAEGDVLTSADFQNYPDILRAAERAPGGDGDPGAVRPLADLERGAIIQALQHFSGNKKRAAEALGIDRRTLYNKIELYGIQVETAARVR